MRPAAGFTLLELLVVASLIAIVSATAVIGLRSLGGDPLAREASRLVAVWNALCEESAQDARPLGLSLAATAWQGVQPGRDRQWRSTPGPAYAVHDLPVGMRLELVDVDADAQPGDSLASEPQLLCLPGGLSQGPNVRLFTADTSLTIEADPDSGGRRLADADAQR